MLTNELKMIKNVSAVYGKKLPSFIENNISDISFGGRKGQAAWVVQKHTAKVAVVAGGTAEAVGLALIAYCENHS